MITETEEALRSLPVFQGLSDSVRPKIIKYCSVAAYESGETILEQNQAPQAFYVLYEGCAEVVLTGSEGRKTVLATLGPGEHFGEMSILTGEPTSAGIVAVEPCKVLVVEKEGLVELLALSPELNRSLVETLSLRLKKVNTGYWQSRQKELALAQHLQEGQAGRYGEIVGKSIKRIKNSIPKWAQSKEPVNLVGHIRTGKELVARSIHAAGDRADKPFVVARYRDLAGEADDKLFGQFGYLELASGGTLLIKGIHMLNPDTLKRLIGYLDHPFTDVRLITTSTFGPEHWSIKPDEEISARLLSNMVFFAPLRERKRDIPELIDYFLERYAKRYNMPVATVSKSALEKLLSYDYSRANFAELEEVVERAAHLADGGLISDEHVFLGGIVATTGPGINILRWRPFSGLVEKGYFPGVIQYAVTGGFLFLLAWLFFGPRGTEGNWASLAAWSIGWPVLILTVAVFGRFTCSVCPFSCLGTMAKKVAQLNKPIPGFIKKYDYLLITFLFVLILWVEKVTDMRHSPVATGALLAAVALGSVAFSFVFPRKTWCRHVCPLGGVAGVGAMASALELRSNTEICTNKCTTHSCYKGSEQVPGCPLFQHAPFVDNNQACKLCLRCVRNCPNGAIQFKLRPPAREIWHLVRVNRGLAFSWLPFWPFSFLWPISRLNVPEWPPTSGLSGFPWSTGSRRALRWGLFGSTCAPD